MLKRMSKAEKRKARETDKGIIDLAKTVRHYFKEFPKWINEMLDPRHQSVERHIKITTNDEIKR